MLVAAERKVFQEPVLDTKPAKRAVSKANLAKGKLCVIGVILTIFAFGVYYTSLSAAIASKGYELEQLKEDISRLETSNERLELTLASMSSLDKVEKIAVEQLGMSKPVANGAALVASVQPENLAGGSGDTSIESKQDKNTFTAGNLYNTLISFFVPGRAQASSAR